MLEDRRLLAMGDLLHTLADPNAVAPQESSQFGYAVAVDGPYTVVGTPNADLLGLYDTGCAYVFNTTTGALVATLNNPTPAVSDVFGSSVAVSGNTVVVGAYLDDAGATDAGSAYVFDAVTGNLLRTINNPTPADSDYFGWSVAVSGSTVVVGAYWDDTGANNAGSAYVFDATTGNLLRTLNNPAPAVYDIFGYSVAVSGSTIVVGANGDDTGANNAGSAYVIDAATGNLLRTLNNPTPAVNDNFGWSVAVSGSTIVVGAHQDDTGATDAGSAYVFDAATGNLLRELNNPTPTVNDYFGYSVAVSGSTIVVGAGWDDTGATDAGSAYVFDAATGNLLRTLNNPTPAEYDYFARAVAVSGSTVVVAAYQDDTGATDTGAAYVFDATTGNLVRTLNDPTPAAYDYFGSSVGLSDSTVVVGAYQGDTGATDAGSAYVFDFASGNLLLTLNNPTPAAYDYFGYSVAVSGSMVVVGAYQDDTGATDAGSAYVFDAATGNLLRTLNNPTPADYDCFGRTVAVSGNTIVVGAANDDTGATDAGSAYVFDAITGNLLRTLNNPTPAAYDYFGYSVAVSGIAIVVGAGWDETGATDAGSAYIFDAATGNLLRTLGNPTPAAGDVFGYSVAVSGSTVVVGALGDDAGASDAGAAYVFDAVTGNLLRTLNNPTPVAGDVFGRSVAVAGSTVMVGAYQDNTGATDAGSAYVFDAASGNLLRTLNNPIPATYDYFGSSVAVAGTKALVGAYGVDGATVDRGAAYVFDVTPAPTDLAISASAVAENQPVGTTVGTLSTTDPNLPYDSHIYSFVTGTGSDDNASFTIAGDQLQTAASFDFETKSSYSVRVRTTDASGLGFEKALTIGVTDVNDPPEVVDPIDDVTVDEDAPDTMVPLSAVFRDVDAGDMVTYSVVRPTNAAAAANRVTETDYTRFLKDRLYTHLGDNRGLAGTQHDLARTNIRDHFQSLGFTVGLESFTYLGSTYYNVVATKLGATRSNDIYLVGAHYDSVDNPGADDNASGVAAIMEIAQVLSSYTFDATLRFVAFDCEEEGMFGSKAYVAAHPTESIVAMINLDMIAFNPAGINHDTISLYDFNGTSTIKPAIISAFVAYGRGVEAINSGQSGNSDHVPFTQGGFNAIMANESAFNQNTNYHKASDAVETANYIDFAYATKITAGFTGYLVDAAGLRTTGGTVNATVTGNQLALAYAPNQNGSDRVTVRATDSAGAWVEDSFQVNVNSVNDPPADIAISETTVAENRPVGTVVGNLSTNDIDNSTGFGYSLVAGVGSDDNASFTIDGDQLKTAASFDFETKASYTLRVRTTDTGGLSFEKAFTINVTDVDDFDRVAVGFGSTLGTWFWKQTGTWTPLHGLTPVWIVSGDLDGNGKADLVVNFGGTTGIWIYHDTGTWQYLHPATSSTAAMADIDGDNRAELILTTSQAGIAGVWAYDATLNTWTGLAGWQAEGFAVGDFDGNGKQDVAVDFGAGKGVWFWNNNTAWQYVHNVNPGWMAAGDLDGNGKTDLAVSVTGANDIWARLDSGTWQYIKSMANSTATAADANGDGRAELFVSITDPAYAGLWEYAMPGSSWKYTTNWRPENLTSADVDGNGKKDIVADFGTNGLWTYKNDASWQWIHSLNPAVMTGTRFGQALMVDAAVAPFGSASLLTYADLAPIVAEAKRRLNLTSDAVFEIADLPEGILGEAIGNRILIDRDAAGYGWFVDQTPTDDLEYQTGDRAAAQHMDLLTAVMHEMGHTAGLSDLDGSVDSLMSGRLKVGLRRR